MTELEKNEMQIILNHFGKNDQIVKFGEECPEAATEVLKWLCSTKDKKVVWESLKGEVADAYNVVGQMMKVFGEDEIKQIAASKRTLCIRQYIDPKYGMKETS